MATVNPFVDNLGELSIELLRNISEILTLRLPEGPDRVIAAKWTKKFRICKPEDFKQYLILFVSSLTKQMLVDPFDVPPLTLSAEWDGFMREYTLQDINNAVIRNLYKESLTPPYKIEVSHNLKEFLCFQEVPFFGAHFYYAFSPHETIDKWSKFNKLNVPRNQIESLRLDEKTSPIAKRGIKKPKPNVGTTPHRGLATPRARPKSAIKKAPRPAWEGPVPEEPEPEAPTRKPMISFSLNTSQKPIPAALQRRMNAALQKSKLDKEKKEKKAQEAREAVKTPSTRGGAKPTLAARGTPSTARGTPSTRGTTRGGGTTKARGGKTQPRGDPIDAQLAEMASARAKTPPPPPPKSPEYTGPFATQRKALDRLRSNNPPVELVQSTRDMKELSEQLVNEAERIRQDGPANFGAIAQLERREVIVGRNVARLIEQTQTAEIATAAETGAQATERLILTMDELERATQSQIPNNIVDITRRLTLVKQNMNETAARANEALAQSEMEASGAIIDQLNGIREANSELAEGLNGLQTNNQNDEILIEGLASIANEIANDAEELSNNLASAVQEGDPNLPNIIYNTAREIPNLIDHSFEGENSFETSLNDIEDPGTRLVAEIYVKQNREKVEEGYHRLIEQSEKTLEPLKFVTNRRDIKAYQPPAGFEENERNIFDVSPVEMVVLPIFPESPSEHLANESLELVDISNEVLDVIENEIQPALAEAQESAANETEKKIIEQAHAEVVECHEEISQCLNIAGTVNQTLELEKSQNL